MVSAVIEGPKTTPSAPAPSSRATEARASATSASVRSAARKAPPWLAEWPERIQAAISSMASSTIWVPAAPSRRAQPSLETGEAGAVHGADPSTVPRHATGRRRRDLAVLRAPRRRRAAAPHPGHERDPPGLGRGVPGRPGRRPRRRRLRPPRHRALRRRRPTRSRSPTSPTTPPGCSTPSAGTRPRAGHLDGRHGRPGARAAPSAADPHADARLHVPRRRGRRSWPTRR